MNLNLRRPTGWELSLLSIPLLLLVGSLLWNRRLRPRSPVTDSKVRYLTLPPGLKIDRFVLSKDGSQLLVGSSATDAAARFASPPPASIRLWDARTLQFLQTFPVAPAAKNASDLSVFALALSPDAHTFCYARQNGKILLGDFVHPPRTLKHMRAYDAVFSPDGRRLLCVYPLGVRIYDLKKQAIVQAWGVQKPQTFVLGQGAWAPDGESVAVPTAGSPLGGPGYGKSEITGHDVELRDVQNGRVKQVFKNLPTDEAKTCAMQMAFSPNGKWLAVTSAVPNYQIPLALKCAILRVFDVKTGGILWEKNDLRFDGQFCKGGTFWGGLAWAPDGKILAVERNFGDPDNPKEDKRSAIVFFDALTGQEKRRLFPGNSPHSVFPPSLRFAPDGKRLYARDSNRIIIWDL